MPELPEVETIRRGLAPVLEGRRLERVDILDARWCRPRAPDEVRDLLEGRTVRSLGRRGKYLVWDLGDEIRLLAHLRMTGTFLVDPAADVPHQRVVLTLGDGRVVRYTDPRRFGTGELVVGDAAFAAFLAPRLGVEPLDGGLTGRVLRERARGRRAPVKAFLLDQRHVAGVGNIYADEALFRARVHPLRPVDRITPGQWDAIAAGVVAALTAGLDAGGATIDDFRHVDGVYGGFQHEFLVHRRRGEPCPTCATTIVKLVAAGRGTYVCPRCQPVPRRRRATA